MIKNNNIFTRFYKHVLVFMFVLLLGCYTLGIMVEQDKNRYLDTQTEILEAKYKTNYSYFKIMSKDIYAIYQDNSFVIDIMDEAATSGVQTKQILREKLYNKLKRRYKRFRNMGVLQLHFHLNDNTSFLRMHKPEKFGDDLSKFRPSVALANKTLTPTEGFEVGRIIHGFRFVYPLFKAKKHIGSMEVSFSSEKLMNTIFDNHAKMLDSHFLVSKNEVQKVVWGEYKNNLYHKSVESPNYLIERQTHLGRKETIVNESNEIIIQKMNQGISFSISSTYNKETSVGTFIPIMDIDKNKTIAYIVVYSETDYLDNLMMKKQYIQLSFISIIVLLFIFSIYVTLNNERLQKMAHYDKLTELSNRAYFYIELEKEINRTKRLNTKLAVMFIDLDGFKAVNDTYGHDAGDQLLVDVSRRLTQSVRDVDIVARLGGDEFTVALTNVAGEEEALLVANKIIDKLSENFLINKTLINIGASIGISLFPDSAKNSDDIIKQSDDAMYMAKDNGKNCAIVYKKNKN